MYFLSVTLKKLIIISSFLLLNSLFCQQSIVLTKRQLCDLELLLNGGFSPLTGFMTKNDYESVIKDMHLSNGDLWPIPIVLDVDLQTAQKLNVPCKIALVSPERILLAEMEVTDIWQPEKQREAQLVYGTTNKEHPGVAYLFDSIKDYYIGGSVKKVTLPTHYDFVELRKTPEQLKQSFKDRGITKIVAFQTRNPMHRAHVELTQRASQLLNAHLLLHPVVCMTKPGDVDHFTRVKCYKKLLDYYDTTQTDLSLLELSMRMAGPREALWHALIRKNFGCTHFIIGRDHAGPGKDSAGNNFYEPYAAQELAKKYEKELGIEVIMFPEMVYVEQLQKYMPIDQVPSEMTILSISGTQFRQMLANNTPIPAWFSYPEIVSILRTSYPPKAKQGITLFFTGLSGAGKSTIADALAIKLRELQNRAIISLDGDQVRKHLSSELTFSKEHRSLNVRRVGFVADVITQSKGIGLCSMIAPYQSDREYVRSLVKEHGTFIEIYVSTPLSVCQERDVKGLYAQAQAGLIQQFTGISDPYEAPLRPEITIDTSAISISDAVQIIVDYLKKNEYI